MSSPTHSTFHPGSVGAQHSEIRLSACAGKSGCKIFLFPFGICDPHDQHVLRQPAFISCDNRGNSEGKALLAKKRIAPIAATKRPDAALFWGMDDILFFWIGGPRKVWLIFWFKGYPTECMQGTKNPSPKASRAGFPMRVMIRILQTTYAESVICTPIWLKGDPMGPC